MTHLTLKEFMKLEVIPAIIEEEAATPEMIFNVMQILERERTRIIAENMQKVIDEEEREENYD